MIKPDKLNEDGLPVLNWEHNEDGLPVIKKKASANGVSLSGGEAGTLNGSGLKSEEKQQILDYMQGLKTPQQKEYAKPALGKPLVAVRPLSEKSIEDEANNKITEISDDDMLDPVRGIDKLSKANPTSSKDILASNKAKEILINRIAPDGFDAKQVLGNTFFGGGDENNATTKILKDKAAKYEKDVARLKEIVVDEDLSKADDDYLQFAYAGKIDRAAIKYYADKHPDFMKELAVSGIDLNDPDLEHRIPSGKKGIIVNEFLHDDNVKIFAEKENPALLPAIESARKNLLQNNHDYAINQVANEVSREVQKSGFNTIDPIVNYYGENHKKYADLTAKQLYANDPEKLEIWNNEIRDNQEKYMDAPSFFEGFASAGKDFGKGIANTFTQPFTPISETIKENWEKEASHVSADPHGFSKFLQDSGHSLGTVASIAATGNVLGAIGIPAATTTAIGVGFLGDQLGQGTIKYPDNPIKAWTSALFNTGVYMAMGARIFPAAKVKQAFEGIKPEINNIVENLVSGKITREAARQEANGIAQKGVDLLAGTASSSAKIGAQLTAATWLNKYLDKIMGADDKWHPEGEEWDTFKSMTLSNLFVAGLGKYGEMRKGNKIVEESLYEAATNPLRYQRIIEDLQVKDPSINKDELLGNLNFLAETKKGLDERGIDEKNQKRYLFEALRDKVATQAIPKDGEASLTKKSKDEVKEIQEIKERILNGEDADTIVTEAEQKQIDENNKKQEEVRKAETDITSLTKKNELDNKEFDIKIKELDKESPTYGVKKQKIEQDRKDKNAEHEAKIKKLKEETGEGEMFGRNILGDKKLEIVQWTDPVTNVKEEVSARTAQLRSEKRHNMLKDFIDCITLKA